VLRILDSEDILIAGFGGPGNIRYSGKFEIYGGRRIALTNTTNDWPRDKQLHRARPLLRAEMEGSPGFETQLDERPVMFKVL
jgi:hypothetical protein